MHESTRDDMQVHHVWVLVCAMTQVRKRVCVQREEEGGQRRRSSARMHAQAGRWRYCTPDCHSLTSLCCWMWEYWQRNQSHRIASVAGF